MSIGDVAVPPHQRSEHLRLSLFYAGFFGVIGVQQPFWPVWLASHGLNAGQIGLVLAVSIGIKAFSGPLAAHVADRTGERRRPVLALVLAGLASFCLFGVSDSFWSILLVSLLFYAVWPPVMSLVESLTVSAANSGQLDYGRIRLWGSLSYIVVAVTAGQILTAHPPSAVFWTSVAAIAGTALTCAWLPDRRTATSSNSRPPLLETLSDHGFVRCLIACALIQGSHAVYYGFATLHWQAAGYSEALIGALWAEGVICEIVLFAFGQGLLRRVGAPALIAIAGISAAVRWLGLGLTDHLGAIVALQALHAFSFGAAHLSAMAYIGGAVAPGVSATAQSLYSGLVWGVGLGLMLLLAGWLYVWLAAGAFLAMAVVAALGALIARPLSNPYDRVTGRRFEP